MTTHTSKTVKCSVCGKNSKQIELASTSTFGSMDLDTRPAEMKRSTIDYWITECKSCGYVAFSLEEPIGCDKEYLDTPEYRNFPGTPPSSKLAQLFIRAARIAEKNQNHMEAFWSYLHAAWVSDDKKDEAWQIELRMWALRMLERFREQDMGDNYRVIRADLLRKTSQFKRLIQEYENIRFDNSLLNMIIQFQISKAKAEDTATYTVEDMKKLIFDII